MLTGNSKLNLLSANPTKWPNTLTQFVGNLPTNCLGVFDHFVGLAVKNKICQECSSENLGNFLRITNFKNNLGQLVFAYINKGKKR